MARLLPVRPGAFRCPTPAIDASTRSASGGFPRYFLFFLTALLVLSGCATHPTDESSPAKPDTEGSFPVTIGSVTIDRQPARIVSLSASATETLYAVGAGAQVVAVDSTSDYPPQAPHTDLNAFTPDPEALSAYRPDLVLVSEDTNGLSAALAKIGVKTLVLSAPATLDEAYQQFVDVGRATGHQAEGESLARQARDDITKIVADTPKPARPLSYYYEVDQTYYSATSATFIGQVIAAFGLANIADGAGTSDYPQLSAEHILQANPGVIFLADTKCCGQNPQAVAARPGWGTLDAVRQGHVVGLDDDIASRWGPRIVDLARAISDGVNSAER